MHPFIQNIRVYFSTNFPIAIISAVGMLFVWLLATVWNGNTEKLTDIAQASQSTAESMQELVIFVKEDRVEINNLKRRVTELEEYKKKHDADVEDFWKNYYYNPNKKSK